jgi:hypothetical protein
MNDITRFLNEGDILSHITRYELLRDEGRLYIDIHEVISEQTDNNYFATPNLIIREAKSEFIGKGNSVVSALEDCLQKIQKHPIDVIFASSPSQSEE